MSVVVLHATFCMHNGKGSGELLPPVGDGGGFHAPGNIHRCIQFQHHHHKCLQIATASGDLDSYS